MVNDGTQEVNKLDGSIVPHMCDSLIPHVIIYWMTIIEVAKNLMLCFLNILCVQV